MNDAIPVACPGCGAPLPPGEGVRQVACRFCQYRGDHPAPLGAGTEVLVKRGLAYDLARVVRCQGPDRIHIEREDGSVQTVPLESLVAVTSDGVESNTKVYARLVLGWQLTWAEKVSAGSVVVKHTSEGFQDDFFNKTVARHDVRVPLRPELRERRTALQQWWVERKKATVVGLVLLILVALWYLLIR